MFGLACLPLGKYRRMFHQPQFVRCLFGARIRELLHRVPDRQVIRPPEAAHA
jgi:hypothetical protein